MKKGTVQNIVIVILIIVVIWMAWPKQPERKYVNVTITCKEDASGDNSDQKIDLYTDAGTYIETVTTSSGTATLGDMHYVGENIICQARQAAPATADPYVGAPVTKQVPPAEEGGDTVPLGTIWVRDVSGTAPTISATDQGSAAISDATTNYLNTTDTRLTIKLTAVDDDTWWGAENDFIDLDTGYRYLGGVVVLSTTASQPVGNADFVFPTPTNVYYIFYGHSFVDKVSVSDDDIHSFDIVFTATLTADATVTIDAYGCQRFDTMATGTFASKLNPTAITTKIA